MFPERKINKPFLFAITSGYSFVFGILLLVERHWIYEIEDNDEILLKICDSCENSVIEKVLTKSDCDQEDRIITVKLSADDTGKLKPGEKYFAVGTFDGKVIIPAVKIKVKSIVESGDNCEL